MADPIAPSILTKHSVGRGSVNHTGLRADFDIIEGSQIATDNFSLQDGTEAAPSLKFTLDSDTGIYRNAGGALAIVDDASEVASFSSTAATNATVTVGDAATTANTLAVGTGAAVSTNTLTVGGAGDTSIISLVGANGSCAIRTVDGLVATVPYSFTSDTNTGMYRNAGGNVAMVDDGTEIANFGTGEGINVLNSGIRNLVGAAGTPSYTFTGDTDTGMYHSAANTVSLAANGAEVFNASNVLINSLVRHNFSAAGATNVAGTAYAGFVFTAASEDIAAGTGGAISVATYGTTISTDVGGDNFTLADGTINGQLKRILLFVDGGGAAVITPANFVDGTTITFDDADDEVILMWLGVAAGGWRAVFNKGGTIA